MAKFGELNPWCTDGHIEPFGVGVWRTFRDLWLLMETKSEIQDGGYGDNSKFWKEGWIDQFL